MDGSISQLRASSSSSRVASQSLTNLYPSNATAPNQSTILPQRLVAGSPQPVSPHPKDQPVSSHLKDQSVSPNPKELAAQESYLQAARNSLLRQRHNHTDPLPVVGNEDETIAERRGASLDTDRLAGGIRNLSVQENAPSVLAEAVADREESHLAGIASGPTSADSVFHYEYIQSPEERNARLESLPQETLAMPRDPSAVGPCGAAGVQTRSPPFTIEWLSTKSVNFTKSL